jgi:hypothetical protein
VCVRSSQALLLCCRSRPRTSLISVSECSVTMSDPSRMRIPPLQCLYNERIGLFVLAPAQNNIQLSKPAGSRSPKTPDASTPKDTVSPMHELAARSEMLTSRCICALGTTERPSAHKLSATATPLSTSHARDRDPCGG